MSRVHLLAADIGNTNVSIGLFEDERMVHSWRAITRATATPDEVASALSGLLALDGHRLDELDAVAIASVVPPLSETWERLIDERVGVEPWILDAGSLEGVLDIRIDRPSEAGADRLANALAARIEHGGPAIVIDLGTSTNFDLVDADGAYIGGAIAPGLGLSLEALVGRASKLPRIELRRPPSAIGANTIHAMQSGTVLGYQALTNGLLRRLRTELAGHDGLEPRDVRAILTGGLSAAPWATSIEDVDAIDPDLTLKGLALLHVAVTGGDRLELGLS